MRIAVPEPATQVLSPLLTVSFFLIRSHKETTKLARNNKREGEGKPKAMFVLKTWCLVLWKAASYQNTPLLHPPLAGDAQAVKRRWRLGEQGLGARSKGEQALTV